MRGVALPLAWPLGVFEEFLAVGRRNSCSILEAFALVEALTGKKMSWEYLDQNREGDHLSYISDLQKIQAHYPSWRLTKSLADIFTETVLVRNALRAAELFQAARVAGQLRQFLGA